jgi:Saxitoxin biosynthesis operon protein SxtJ
MAISSIDRHPAPDQLRSFGVLLAIFVPVLGVLIWWRTGRFDAGTTIWIAGGVLTAIYWMVPPVRRLVYVGWMYAAFPIGWTVSHILMALIFYLVITPIGWMMRATGRDPLFKRFDRSARTYWMPHTRQGGPGRYFRQY